MFRLIVNYTNIFFLKDTLENIHLHTSVYESDNLISQSLMDQIELEAIRVRGDNINTEISFHIQQQHVIFNIGFLEREYFEHANLTQIPVLKNLEFVKAIEEKLLNYLRKSERKLMPQITTELSGTGDLLVLSLHEDEETVDRLLEELNEQNVEVVVLKRSKWNSNAGASTFGEEIIIWVANLIVGGLAWDILKTQTLRLLDWGKPYVVREIQMEKLLNYISEVTGENPQSFSLLNVHVQENGQIKFQFQNYYQEIEVTTDSKYNIVKLNINELTKTRI